MYKRQVLTFPKYDTLNYTTPLKRLVEGFIFRYNVRPGLMRQKCGKNEIKNKYYVVYSFCTSALGQVLRIIALQDPAVLYLDLYREASLRPYRLNTASS